jgi:hypothetical protein
MFRPLASSVPTIFGLIASAGLCTAADAPKLTYIRDVAPILNKAGCTAGPCHGAAKGKNGFKLSLRGYDARFDYEALLYDLSGRRFNRADPARSLMLAKPTQQVAHGGGLRFEANSSYYKVIHDWIAQGAPFGDPKVDLPARIDVEPKEVSFAKPGESAQLRVTAVYGDQATREVTAESVVESNTPDIAAVEGSQVKGARVGEAAVLVRYEGKFVTVPVTVLNPKPGFAWTALPQYNYIDELIDQKLRRLKIQPSPLVDDAGFLRRASLDLTGQLPTPEDVRAFLADRTPSRLKRSKLIDKLIASPAFVDHWTVKLADLLQNNRKYLGEKGAYAFQDWIRQSLAENRPYDQLVRELLTSRGSSYENPAANFFRVTRDAKPTMEKTTQVFLGVRMVCAQCHDHPFERWTQNQYYEMASFFGGVDLLPGYEVGEEIVFDKRQEFDVKHPKDGRLVKPNFLVAAKVAGPVSIPSDATRRQALAGWITSKENPFFAKSTVNRFWSYFFGRGIIDPVDDIRASNPPSNPALLAALEKDFVAHGFDLRYLMRTIANSRAYQASIVTNEWNQADEINFSHATPRRLTAEQLMDALAIATGVRVALPDVPPDTRAEQLVDPHIGKEGFLDLFGRPARESACECERRAELSLPQALNLVNGKTISDAVADQRGRIAKAVLGARPDAELVEELYFAAFSRPPTAGERENGIKYLLAAEGGSAARGRAARAQDLLWALVNSKAFLYNH